jgi:pimeloyl-ACP methyl ester carboxylesterase
MRLLLVALAAMIWQNNRALAQGAQSPTPLSPASANALGPGFSDHYATVHDIRLHYVAGGHGPPVILVPGWPETWWAWRKLMPRLAQRFTVIAVDTPGMGESSQPTSGYDMSSVSDDLRDLMGQLGYRRFHVVGHDIGVWISYAMAVDHPDAVDRLALLDSNIPGVTPSPPIFLPKTENTHSWHFMFNQLDDLPEILVSGHEREYLSWIFRNYAHKPEAVAIDEYIRAYSVPGAMRAGFAYYRALPVTIEQNKERMHSRLAIPILALGGEYGTADVAKTSLKSYADNLRGSVLPECGHYVPEECPSLVLEQLVPFLEGH